MPLIFVFDSASGVDDLSISSGNSTPIEDISTGVDTVAVAKLITILDTGIGIDELNRTGADNSNPIVEEFTTGVDDIVISVAFTLTDGLNATEAIGQNSTSTFSLAIAETTTGVDAVSIAVSIAVTDVGVGTDTDSAPSEILLTDTSSGTDEVTVNNLKIITDTGFGDDSSIESSPPASTPSAPPATPATVISLVKNPTLPGYVELFKIDCTEIPGLNVIYYVTANVNSNNTKVTFGGNTYEPYPVILTGFEQSGEGAPARPTLTIGNINILFGTLSFLFEDIIGAKIIYYRTFAAYLGTGSEVSAPPLTFYIGKKVSHTIKGVTWELRSPIDKERSFLPKRQMLKRDFPGLGINKAIQ